MTSEPIPGRGRLAFAIGLTLLAAGCSQQSADSWIVTDTNHYPAHVNVIYAGQCPRGAADSQNLSTNCTKHETNYPELWEVCATRRGVNACWYVPADQSYTYEEQHVGQPLRDREDYNMIDEHPSPTNEWDGQR
jgi:hypothetical protein